MDKKFIDGWNRLKKNRLQKKITRSNNLEYQIIKLRNNIRRARLNGDFNRYQKYDMLLNYALQKRSEHKN